MAKVNVGTTTYVNSNFYGWQRKIIKTSDGNLFLFAILGTTSDTRLQYKKSTDNGDTWGSWIPVYTAGNVVGFDIYNDNNNLYLTFNSTIIRFIKLTYSAGTYSIGSTINVVALNYISDSITKRTDGNYWIVIHSGSTIYSYYSDDDGATWNSGGNISAGATVYGAKIIPKGSNLWVLFQAGTGLKYAEYTTSWGSPIEIAAALSVQATTASFFAEKVSDTDIWIGGQKYNASAVNRVIKIWHYTGSWDSGTEISNSGTNEDKQPTISIVADKPVVVWNENANANINYRRFNGVSWDSIQTLDSTNVFTPAICERDDNWLYTYWMSGTSSPYTFYFDKANLNPTKTKDLTSDMHIKAVGLTKDLTSDMEITATQFKDLTSDMTIISTEQEDLTSDMDIINDRVQIDLTSDMTISSTAIKDLLSDMYVVNVYFADVNNKVSFTKQTLYDIANKFSFAKRILSDVVNAVTFVKNVLSDVNNDFRMKIQKLYDVKNDVRFIKSWQKAGNFGFQSLGKEYIKVYFDSVEQTDAIVTSIRINKGLNGAHIAAFELGRAYDSTKPNQEAIVEIKYNDWLLYKGYIVAISPTDNPEHMLINCQDKFWYDNRTNKYFRVGHKPSDDREKYYEKINTAVSTEFSWNPNLGNFVPQEIDCFALGTSDALTNLITEAGNYAWFYDVNWQRKLWTAGAGEIKNIQRQELGTNLELYKLIEHRFDEDVSGIINKFRVQMGEKVIRKSGSYRKYAGYRYSNFKTFLEPEWDASYEIHSSESGRYGWDNPDPDPDESDKFKDVFRKYNIPRLDSRLSSWSDRYPPYIEVFNTVSVGFWVNYGYPIGRITEGFTIDYENGIVIFNEPIFLWYFRDDRYRFRAPTLRLNLFKKNYYTVTSTPSEDPESVEGNPLVFFTNKMGSYPVTIIDDLLLSNLTVQEGGEYYDASGVKQIIPSWDDTEFARDYANWQLSKVCDKKIRGTIDLTLDTICFYNIDLSKRIYIDGITESPMNIVSMNYDLNRFLVTITIENSRYYRRTVSLPSRGD